MRIKHPKNSAQKHKGRWSEDNPEQYYMTGDEMSNEEWMGKK